MSVVCKNKWQGTRNCARGHPNRYMYVPAWQAIQRRQCARITRCCKRPGHSLVSVLSIAKIVDRCLHLPHSPIRFETKVASKRGKWNGWQWRRCRGRNPAKNPTTAPPNYKMCCNECEAASQSKTEQATEPKPYCAVPSRRATASKRDRNLQFMWRARRVFGRTQFAPTLSHTRTYAHTSRFSLLFVCPSWRARCGNTPFDR